MKTTQEERICIVDGQWGIYIPQRFAYIFRDALSPTYRAVLLGGPSQTLESEEDPYWNAWDDAVRNLTLTIDGRKYRLVEDGDLFIEEI